MKSVIAAIALFATVSHAAAGCIWNGPTDPGSHPDFFLKFKPGAVEIWGTEGEEKPSAVCKTYAKQSADGPKELAWMKVVRMKCDTGDKVAWIQTGPDTGQFDGVWVKQECEGE